MRVVIVTESFPPDVNGVAHCAFQTARHLAERGHTPVVIAPATADDAPDDQAPCPVVRVPSLPLPGYPQVRVALPGRRLAATLAEHRADVVHLAGPFVLGVRGMAAAARLGLPAVAVYQTDLAGYARTYLGAGEATAWRRLRSVHTAADLTLAPSSAALRDLEAHGVPRVKLWPRGVDTARFRPGLRDERCAGPSPRTASSSSATSAGSPPRSRWSCWPVRAPCPGCGSWSSATGPAGPGRTGAARRRLPGPPHRRRPRPALRLAGRLRAHRAVRDLLSDRAGGYGQRCARAAPAAGGPLDLVAHGRTGLARAAGRRRRRTRRGRALAAEPALRAAYGAAGRATVEGRTWAAVGDQLIGHYADVLAGRRTAVAA
ncbi:Glycosyltransferase family 1 protein OS=Streptomyces tendae OX=1932 GN=GUR47_32550 PE=4 SV=1 [Streptomyces tendae]